MVMVLISMERYDEMLTENRSFEKSLRSPDRENQEKSRFL